MDFVESSEFEPVRGTRQYVSLRVGDLPNGYPVQLPVMAVSGTEDGPVLFVNACMHGDEVLGSDVVRRTVNALAPEQLRGALICVPMANPTGVATRTRRNVVEMYPGPHDMNRVFPGDSEGVLTERLAALLHEKFIEPADYAFDLHCASVGGEWQPYTVLPREDVCRDQETYQRSKALAAAFGAPNLLAGTLFPGSFVDSSVTVGTPASMCEFGVANFVDRADQSFGMRGMSNLLKHLGMIAGEPEVPSEQTVLTKLHRLKTGTGGYLVLDTSLGDDIKAGDRVAHVEDLAGSVVADFESPVDGRVCRVNTMGVVGTGDIVAYVAETA